jgi:hypothetical protein
LTLHHFLEGLSKQAIANAAIMTDKAHVPIAEIDPQAFEDHWRVNVSASRPLRD